MKRDFRTWWAQLENGVSVVTPESFVLMSLWMFGKDIFDYEEIFRMDWDDIGNKLCVVEQLWAIREGWA